jgi:DNA-binding GntR family transcriptional regulator
VDRDDGAAIDDVPWADRLDRTSTPQLVALGGADVRDSYAVRRLIECAAVAAPTSVRGLSDMRAAVEDGPAAATRGDRYEVDA